MMNHRDPGSFRDPDGGVYYSGDTLFRTITSPASPILDPDCSEFLEAAVEANLLVAFSPLDDDNDQSNSVAGRIRLERIPIVTYPFEWSFRQLKEAALTTLEINILALDHGLTLKDATGYNCQIKSGAMIFIDHGSFERTDGRLPWRPYGQFCRHFLAPLAIASTTGVDANRWLRAAIDGLDIWETSRLLPLRSYLKLSHLLHIHLHGRAIKKFEHADTKSAPDKGGMARGVWSKQHDLLMHLKRCVEKLKIQKTTSAWTQYCDRNTYDPEQFSCKEAFVTSVCAEHNFQTVWDLGANNGHFSRLAAEHGGTVLSMDSDPMVVDENWRINQEQAVKNIVPIVCDILNPSPGIGFANEERPELESRSKPDIVLVLALIHHMVIAGNVPLQLLARYLHNLGADTIIEFVGREDRQVQKLLSMRSDSCESYNQDLFETAFSEIFSVQRTQEIPGSQRVLYHFRPKEAG